MLSNSPHCGKNTSLGKCFLLRSDGGGGIDDRCFLGALPGPEDEGGGVVNGDGEARFFVLLQLGNDTRVSDAIGVFLGGLRVGFDVDGPGLEDEAGFFHGGDVAGVLSRVRRLEDREKIYERCDEDKEECTDEYGDDYFFHRILLPIIVAYCSRGLRTCLGSFWGDIKDSKQVLNPPYAFGTFSP